MASTSKTKWAAQVVAAVSIHAILLIVICVVWANESWTLAMGRDANLTQWLALKSLEWSSPFAVTTVNPYQGMGSMLMPINAWWIPGLWPMMTPQPTVGHRLFSELIYVIEVIAAVHVLGIVLGLAKLARFGAVLLSIIVLFPPFNFKVGLDGWIATSPVYGHTFALTTLLFAAIAAISVDPEAPRARTTFRNLALIAAAIAVLYLLLMAGPFWNAGMLIGTAIGLGVISIASTSRATFLWRLAAGVAILTWALGSGMIDFLKAAYAISARFSTAWHFVLNWPQPPAEILTTLCGMGVVCHYNPLGMGLPSVVVHIGLICGLVLTIVFGTTARLRRLAVVLLVVWLLCLVYWTALAARVLLPTQFASMYAYLPLYTLLSIVACAGAGQMIASRAAAIRIPGQFVRAAAWALPALAAAAAMAAVLWIGRATFRIPDRPGAVPAEVAVIESELGLLPGGDFRGLLATVLSDLNPVSDFPDGALAIAERNIAALTAGTGSSFMLLDAWERNIPTLEEYGQAITLPLKVYEKYLLSDGRTPSMHFVFASRANVPILESMGVSQVITDGVVDESEVELANRMSLSDGRTIYRYRLHDPNLNGRAIFTLLPFADAEAAMTELKANPSLVRTSALVSTSSLSALRLEGLSLVAPSDTDFRFVPGGARFRATSGGTSAVLLPMQFSRCYAITNADADGTLVAAVRANLLHTLIVFSGTVDLSLEWAFNFFGNDDCRGRDAQELDALGVRELLAR